jgi:hypothetical protein
VRDLWLELLPDGAKQAVHTKKDAAAAAADTKQQRSNAHTAAGDYAP